MRRGLHRRSQIEHLELRRLLSAIYVDAISPGPTHDGSSWTNAYTDLQQALMAATSGATIKIGQGTYFPTTGMDRTATFQLQNREEIDGGFAGYGAADPDARDVMLYPTILSGDIGTRGDTSDNSYHVVTISDLSSTEILDGLTITDGNADNDTHIFNRNSANYGAGIYDSGNLTISNCAISNNTAYSSGGGIAMEAGDLIITNSSFSGNVAQNGQGGAIYNLADSTPGATPTDPGSLTITGATIENNSAREGGGIENYGTLTISSSTISGNVALDYAGGGVDNYGYAYLNNTTISNNTAYTGGGMANFTKLTVTSCSVTGNTASNGGGMANYGTAIHIYDSTISGNTANGRGGSGGIASYDPTYIYDSTISGNKATEDGGGGIGSWDSLTIVSSTITGNSAATNGGGIESYGPMDITGSIISGNSAVYGGGIYSADPFTLTGSAVVGNVASSYGGGIDSWDSLTITNSTITGNSAGISGGALENGDQLSLTNSILWGDSAPANPEIDLTNAITTVATYSDIEGGFTGTANIAVDPLFARNTNPGADGIWGTTDDDYGDLRLQFTSPCIDAGSNAAVASGETTDLDGNPRIFDFPGVNNGAGVVVDMGAYELGYNLDQVIVPAGQKLALPAGGYPFSANSISIGTNGTLDIADDSLTIASASPSAIAGWLSTGYAGGLWNGVGINSSAAGDSSFTTGVGYFVDGSQVTIGRTWNGDANLDGKINADDLSLMMLGQTQHGTRWQDGNFNYDAGVDGDDWMKLMYALAYSNGQSLGGAFSSGSSVQNSQVSTMKLGAANLTADAFGQSPVFLDDYLDGLLDSPQAVL